MSDINSSKDSSIRRGSDSVPGVPENQDDMVQSRRLPRVVYLVDDDDAVRDSLKVLLEAWGLTVEEYGSAAAFLADTCDYAEACLLVDVHMPGMTGSELLSVLQQRPQRPVSIAITGAADSALRQRLARTGAFAVLDKPVQDEVLLQTIARAFA